MYRSVQLVTGLGQRIFDMGGFRTDDGALNHTVSLHFAQMFVEDRDRPQQPPCRLSVDDLGGLQPTLRAVEGRVVGAGVHPALSGGPSDVAPTIINAAGLHQGHSFCADLQHTDFISTYVIVDVGRLGDGTCLGRGRTCGTLLQRLVACLRLGVRRALISPQSDTPSKMKRLAGVPAIAREIAVPNALEHLCLRPGRIGFAVRPKQLALEAKLVDKGTMPAEDTGAPLMLAAAEILHRRQLRHRSIPLLSRTSAQSPNLCM